MHTLVLLGELDRASAATLEGAIEGLCETEVAGITLDLSKLTYIDTIGVAVIAFRCRWCERRGYEFALIPGPDSVHHAFELAGAIERLPFLAPEPAAQAPASGAQSTPAGVTSSAVAYERTGSRVQVRAPGASHPRSVTLLRISGRRTRARRARRGRGGR